MRAYVGGNPVSFIDPEGRSAGAIFGALFTLGGVALATYAGYQAGKDYGLARCKTEKKFDDRMADPNTVMQSQKGALYAERVSNVLDAAGPFVVEAVIGLGFATAGGAAAGNPFAGAALATGGAALGFYFGQKDCKCP